MTLSINSSLSDVIKVVARTERIVNGLEASKRAGRNVTGARTVPSDTDDLLSGDVVGDYLYDAANNHYYELVVFDGINQKKWVQYAINTGF
jgi:hypothetical protein